MKKVRNKLYIISIVAFLLLFQTVFTMPAYSAAEDIISVNFVKEDIRVVLHTLSVLSGVNIIMDESVAKDSPTITLNLENVSFTTAIDLITKAKGLSYRNIDNAIIIERSDVASSDMVKFQHVQAEDMKKALQTVAGAMGLKMETDVVSNTLLLTGSPLAIDRVKKMAVDLDQPSQQIELEAKVVSLSKSATKDLGMDWTFYDTPQFPDVDTTYETYTVNGVENTVPKTTVTRKQNVGIIPFGRNPEGIPYEFYYSAKVNALISKGQAQVLAKPKITTINGKEARILIGDRIPVVTQSTVNGQTTNSTEYLDTGIKLTYTPVINAEGQIFAKVHTEVSTPELVSDIKAYRISTREAETNVRMKDGETIVIGGLIGSQTSKTNSKVPFLSDLPILGSLFKAVHNTGSDSEVVIFLTAHVVK